MSLGSKHVVGRKQVERLKSGCILANMGHCNQEIDVEGLMGLHHERIRKHVMRIQLTNGKKIFLLAEVSGCGLVNLGMAHQGWV
jgi:adenosylhomocysteinase